MTENEYLDFIRDVIGHSVYSCPCGFRAYGMPVSAHELKTGHRMIKETPNETLPIPRTNSSSS